MLDSVNFISPEKTCYDKLCNVFFNELKIDLNKQNINYTTFDKCQKNSINIFTHLEETYIKSKDFGIGKSMIIVHGMSTKNYSTCHLVKYCINNSDILIAPTQKWIDDYNMMGANKSKIKLCGCLKVDYLQKLQKTIQVESNTICYAPNHNNQQDTISSYPLFVKYLEPLKNKYNIIISPHPFNSTNNIPTTDNLCRSQIVICDVGSVSYESMLLNKPVIFIDFISKEFCIKLFKDSYEGDVFEKQIGYHIEKSENLEKIIKRAFEYGVKENQKEFINKIYPMDTLNKSASLITNEIKKLLGG